MNLLKAEIYPTYIETKCPYEGCRVLVITYWGGDTGPWEDMRQHIAKRHHKEEKLPI